jgi:hypothetical protein
MHDKVGKKPSADSGNLRQALQFAVGKRTRIEELPAPHAVQAKGRDGAGAGDGSEVHRVAQSGVSGPGGQLPFLGQIQSLFGRHDVSAIRAHTGGAAESANAALGSRAYATGSDVAFTGTPDLHTAAHEAAHVVQQRAGVQLKGGVGEAGDAYERHADAVADRVVAGRSAADLLGPVGGSGTAQVQKKDEIKTAGLDYQAGGTFTGGSEAEKEIGPGSGPRYHIPPEEVPAMLSSLLSSENSKEVLEGHIKGVEQRVIYWQQTLPDFRTSPTAKSIADLLVKVKDKAKTAPSGRSTRNVDPVKVVSIVAPIEPATEGTWKQWLIDHKAEKEAVLAIIINKANLVTNASDGKVADIEDPKSTYKTPLAAAILALQKDTTHHDYATSLAQALWSSGSVKADDAFRQKDGWMSDLGYAVYYDSIAGRLASFDAMASSPQTKISNAARTATSEYMEKWVHDKKSVGPGDAKIRKAFYEAVKDLVRRTRSGTLALGFMTAMTDIMVANVDDPNVRTEVPDVERDLRDILIAAGAPTKQVDAARDEYTDSINEKTKLMDKDIHKNSVEVHYIKLYIGIRQAVQSVGEAWIAKKTQHLRDKLGDLSTARTWVGRGVNVAWSFCPGPEFAVPVVLVGTIVDIFLEMEAAKVQANLTAYEAQLRSILDKESSSRLDNIASQAQTDFGSIDAGKAPSLDKKIFQSVGEIEKLYSSELLKALGS